ncbi:thioesterase, FlK family [Hymenobacter sp.]|uniref:thioesterase family protein n=1 Tax=Hymenobacter sp. TaxID=1898978 RepID=UPI00286D3C97|nr:hypothetical protein [Hymenobacter sp.]
MANLFRPGAVTIPCYMVGPADRADFSPAAGGPVHKVLSTFALGCEMEWAARLFVPEMKGADGVGVGTELFIWHHAPAFASETVVVTVTFDALHGANLCCAVEARVGPRLVATGTTGQHIGARARRAAHFAALQAAAPAPSGPYHFLGLADN